MVKNLATVMVAGLLKAQRHSQKTIELADHLMMTNQKLQAGSVLMNVLGPQGVPEEPMDCEFAVVRSSILVEMYCGDVLDLEVESINWQQHLPSVLVYDSRKRDKGRSRYRVVIFQFLAEAFPARR